MSRLFNRQFQNFLELIPDDGYDVELLTKIFVDCVPEIAQSCGLSLLKIMIHSPEEHKGGQSIDQEIVIVENRLGDESAKELVFKLGNGGYHKVVAAPAEGKDWDEELENDFYILSRVLYMIYGRARVLDMLTQYAYRDKLTGIANESALFRFMGRHLGMGDFVDYCSNFVNIKNMKMINDRYDMNVGDRLIIEYAKKVDEFVNPFGCAARMGGDNFVIFVPKDKQAELLQFLGELQIELQMTSGQPLTVNVESRVGYHMLQPGNNISDAMANSSIALAQAKKSSNPDILKFEDHMKLQMVRIKQLEQSMPRALQNEEFVVYYQPKVDIEKDGEYVLCGAEALVRWCQDGQMISPGEFIPLLEKNGMIDKVDFYVFERVCRDIKMWEEKGITPVCVSSNFSRRHLRDEDFADKVEAIIKKYDVNPEYLEIEITESYDNEDMEALTRFEQRMHTLGVDLSMDDFGSGFSSLKMLKDMAADTIKLDKSIIDGVGGHSPADESIVAHIIHMIHDLGKSIIAEGVESQEQADFLRANGCYKIQGFLYGRPMPIEEFEKNFGKNFA